MSYINNNFLSNTFLKNWEEKKIAKEAEKRIDDLLYPFDILKEISKENREYLSEEQLKNWVYENVIQAFGYLETENLNGIIKIYNKNKEKMIALDFKKEVFPLTMEFGKYQDLKVIDYAKKNKFKLAILTDGCIWRIYKLDAANYFETYIQIDISNFLKTEEKDFSIQLLESFINYENLNSSKENSKSNLEIIFEESENTIKKIEKELKGKMEDILSGIGLGFKEASGKEYFNEEDSKNLYNDSIVVLYRTLFIIYAEAKNILPVNNPEYYSISISKMITDIENELENNEKDLWEKIEKLFSWIDKGYEGIDLKVEAYNGGLFNNNNKHYLGKFAITNRHWIKVLKKLGYYEKKEQLLEKIDFADLSTRSFGTLYEGILDYNMFIASEDLIKRSKDSKVTYIPISKVTPKKTDVIIKTGEIYLSEDALERKETGAYYTPEPIVEYIVNNTVDVKLDEVLKEIQEEIAKQKEEIEFEYNSSLKSALQEKFFEDIINKIREKVLKISILDNAMGSGHFLVNAAYHIAAKVFNFLHENIKFETLEDKEIGKYNYWIRMAVTHNIYGVDINKLAVQLGKLSLWLISATKDRPLSFIDHHLKYGNSLVGTSRESIDNTLGDNIGKNQNRRLFDITINNLMSYVDAQFKTLEKMPEETADQIHEKEKFYYEDIEGHLKAIKTKWDIYLAMQINDKKGIVKKEIYDQIVNTNLETLEESYPNFKDWIEQAKENQFFHWELEFPEVFSGNNKGFDCVIGNPPYIDSETMVKKNSKIRNILSLLYNTTKGNWDIYVPFIEKSYYLLKQKGIVGYITPNKWLSIEYGKALRKLIAKNIYEICDYSNSLVFSTAGVYTCVFFISKFNIDLLKIILNESENIQKIKYFEKDLDKIEKNIGFYISKESKILEKITGESLGNITQVSSAFTTSEAYELKNIIKNRKNEDKNFYKFINTGTIDKYMSLYGLIPTTYLKDNYELPIIPVEDFKKNFEKRYKKFNNNKIIITGMRNFECYYDEKNEYVAGKSTVVINNFKNIVPEYILAILNSDLIEFYIKESFKTSGMGGGISFTPKIVSEIKIKLISLEKQQEIAKDIKRLNELSQKIITEMIELKVFLCSLKMQFNFNKKLQNIYKYSLIEIKDELKKQELNLESNLHIVDYIKIKQDNLKELYERKKERVELINNIIFTIYELENEEIKLVREILIKK